MEVGSRLDTDLVEHRMDFMDKIEDLDRIYSKIKVPVIATNRSVNCGGRFRGDEKERVAYLVKAIEAGCGYVDIELETKEELKKWVIQKAREKDCKVIISVHDFGKTPEIDVLLGYMRQQKKEGADIGKIVTMANSLEDCHRMLGLLLEAKRLNFPLLAFAMGELGTFTRVISGYYGAPFVYASVNEQAGPGQLGVESLRIIYGEMG